MTSFTLITLIGGVPELSVGRTGRQKANTPNLRAKSFRLSKTTGLYCKADRCRTGTQMSWELRGREGTSWRQDRGWP